MTRFGDSRNYDDNTMARRTPADIKVIDVAETDWSTKAVESLRSVGFARLRLAPSEISCMRELYSSMQEMSESEFAYRQLVIPDSQFDDLDRRSGYVTDSKREFFELHRSCASAGNFNADKFADPLTCRFLRCVWEATDFCGKHCDEALLNLSNAIGGSPLADFLAPANKEGFRMDDLIQTMMRVYRYDPAYDNDFSQNDGHYDMGLLTILPRSSSAGLEIFFDGQWFFVEEEMGIDEALLIGGMTLARLTGIQALFHRVYTNHRIRFSAPFFQRVAPQAYLPPSPGHAGEVTKKLQRPIA